MLLPQVLFTDWFFAEVDTTLFQSTFLTALQDTLRWCIGVDTTTGDLGVFDCTNTPTGVLTDWFFDGVTTRVHLSGHPFMCATLFTTGGRRGCPGNGTGYNDIVWNVSGDATNVSSERGFAGSPFRSAANDAGGGGRLEWTPCAPCTIGTERILIGQANESGVGATVHNEVDTTSSLFADVRTTQLLSLFNGALYAVLGSTEAPTGIDLTTHDQNLGYVVVATTIAGSGSWWYGYVLDDKKRCATITITYTNTVASDGTPISGSTKYNLTWEGCDPLKMFPGGGGVVMGCTQDATRSAFSVGIFQYVCTRGYGGPIHSVEPINAACTLADGGVVLAVDGLGIGATIISNANGTFSVRDGGFG